MVIGFLRQRQANLAFEKPARRKHSSISHHPLLKNGTLLAANSLNWAAAQVNPSKKYNPPGEHLADFVTT
jgi:hypothetical protein